MQDVDGKLGGRIEYIARLAFLVVVVAMLEETSALNVAKSDERVLNQIACRGPEDRKEVVAGQVVVRRIGDNLQMEGSAVEYSHDGKQGSGVAVKGEDLEDEAMNVLPGGESLTLGVEIEFAQHGRHRVRPEQLEKDGKTWRAGLRKAAAPLDRVLFAEKLKRLGGESGRTINVEVLFDLVDGAIICFTSSLAGEKAGIHVNVSEGVCLAEGYRERERLHGPLERVRLASRCIPQPRNSGWSTGSTRRQLGNVGRGLRI